MEAGLTGAYTDNGDGTITDTRTGLTWEKLSDDDSVHDQDDTYTWDDAFAFKVAALNGMTFAGHTDWRVPNVNELQSIASYGAVSPAVSAALSTACVADCTVLTCSCTPASNFWSSTTNQDNPIGAWSVGFADGSVYPFSKISENSVRAVRGGS